MENTPTGEAILAGFDQAAKLAELPDDKFNFQAFQRQLEENVRMIDEFGGRTHRFPEGEWG